jgi:hypothetical protein
MTPERLKTLLEEFCGQNGGGYCSAETGPARYGGVCGELVWAGFDDMEVAERQVRIRKFLHERLAPSEASMVNTVYAKGVKEKAVEDAIGTYRDAELPWTRHASSSAHP